MLVLGRRAWARRGTLSLEDLKATIPAPERSSIQNREDLQPATSTLVRFSAERRA